MTKKIIKRSDRPDLFALPVSAIIDSIFKSKDPSSIVRSLPEEEAWLAIKKASPEQALFIFSKTTPSQVQYIFDIELWKRDRFRPDAALFWLARLKECGAKKVLEWAKSLDPETILMTFIGLVTVMKKESKDDDPLEREWPGTLPPATVDGSYYYQCEDEKSDEIVRPVFETIAKQDHDLFVRICEAVIGELRSNVEEEAFSWRTKRLMDKGFLSHEEALHVYAYLNERQIANLPRRQDAAGAFDEGGTLKSSAYPLTTSGEAYPLLMIALSQAKDKKLMDDVKLELASLANKILMADSRPVMPESIEAALKKAMGYVNIGLERLSGADPSKAFDVLKERWLLHLFQVGNSVIMKARQYAKKFVTKDWPAMIDGDLSLLEEETALKISGILRKRPLCFSGQPQDDPYHDFRNIDEVRDVERCVEEADLIGRIFKEVFGAGPGELKNVSSEKENISFRVAILTIWAKGLVSGSYKFSPLTEEEFNVLLGKAFTRDGFKLELSAKFRKWLIDRLPDISGSEQRIIEAFVNDSFAMFADEFAELGTDGETDFRFIQSIWVIPAVV